MHEHIEAAPSLGRTRTPSARAGAPRSPHSPEVRRAPRAPARAARLAEHPPRTREVPVRSRTWALRSARLDHAQHSAARPRTACRRVGEPARRSRDRFGSQGLADPKDRTKVGPLAAHAARPSLAPRPCARLPRPRSSTGRAPALYPGGSGSIPDAGSKRHRHARSHRVRASRRGVATLHRVEASPRAPLSSRGVSPRSSSSRGVSPRSSLRGARAPRALHRGVAAPLDLTNSPQRRVLPRRAARRAHRELHAGQAAPDPALPLPRDAARRTLERVPPALCA